MFYFGFHKTAANLPWHGIEIFQTVESRYGEIDVIKVRDQSSIYTSGHLMFTYPDSQSEEMNAHLPMALHPSPLKILVTGGSPGILKELLKYPVDNIDFIELDPKIVDVSLNLLNSREDLDAVNDRRVRIIVEDGRRFIKKLKKPAYDLIILNLPQPSTAGINRFYTTDFFREAKDILKRDGIIFLSISRSTGYIGKRMQTASGSIYNSLKSVFRYVEVTAQEYGGLFASDSVIQTEPEILENRFARRTIQTKHFNQFLFRDAFSPINADYVKKRLGEITLVNTDLRPSAYLYNLMLWAEVHGGKILHSLLAINGWDVVLTFAIALVCIALISYRKKKRVIYFSIFTTGFSGMSFVLTVILAYQAIYGYVYEMIGILSATFMIGLWIGTLITRNVRKPLRILFYLELTTILLSISSSLFFKAEFFFYLLVFLAGIITGSQFSTANLSMGDPEAGGKLYAMDLIGSFSGALIPSLIIIPLFGASNALLLIASIKAFSALMIRSVYPKSYK
jgi:spermidine synthase